MRALAFGLVALTMSAALSAQIQPGPWLGQPDVRARLEGEMGNRLEAIAENWLIPAPDANPAMLEMLRLRDRQPPYENPVPWAGEFAGKYLTAGVSVARLVDVPALDQRLVRFVDDLLANQAEDGYMGPFPKDRRLLGEWDLWGHYHVTLGMLEWYRDTGDERALACATKMADLMCRTYLDGDRRVHDAGSHEMNMAVVHSLGMLYRETGESRYLDLMREIETDWEKPPAGDYFRQGVSEVPFYQTPKPRWESLHVMQGLGEIYRITGDQQYKRAHLHYWHSIRDLDIHNSGSFSTNEGAVGNPFTGGAIETCCTVAWIAYSIDALRMDPDVKIADAIELATWNAVMGYQHPSGRWCTYDTPMDGKRLASAHSIVFQSRPGTPELNCCSVNGPRGLGMISEWAVLGDGEDLYLNYFGPGTLAVTPERTGKWTFVQETAYPADGAIRIGVSPPETQRARLHVRIPAWADGAQLSVNGDAIATEPGTYAVVDRTWTAGDKIELQLPMTIRSLRADQHREYRSSLYRGPLLLAYDQKYNPADPADIPELDLANLKLTPTEVDTSFRPIVLFEAQSGDGPVVTLCDFASAGAHGTYYQSWLPIRNVPPVAFRPIRPSDGEIIDRPELLAAWSGAAPDATYTWTLRNASGATVLEKSRLTENHLLVSPLDAIAAGTYSWGVTARLNGKDYPQAERWRTITISDVMRDTESATVHDGLNGESSPHPGGLLTSQHIRAAPDRNGNENGAIRFDGTESKVVYDAPKLSLHRYSAGLWFKAEDMGGNDSGLHQLMSCWTAPSDDPLRITVQGMHVFARIETPGAMFTSPGFAIKAGDWHHVAAVKSGEELRLYLDGEPVHTMAVPMVWESKASRIGLGCNPNFSDLEGYKGAIDAFTFANDEWTDADIFRMAGRAD